MELLILLLSLPLCITWAYRGGSLYKQQQWGWLGNTRWLTLLATPLFITVTYTVSMSESLTTGNIIGLLFGFISFFGAQADGWGRQMELMKVVYMGLKNYKYEKVRYRGIKWQIQIS